MLGTVVSMRTVDDMVQVQPSPDATDRIQDGLDNLNNTIRGTGPLYCNHACVQVYTMLVQANLCSCRGNLTMPRTKKPSVSVAGVSHFLLLSSVTLFHYTFTHLPSVTERVFMWAESSSVQAGLPALKTIYEQTELSSTECPTGLTKTSRCTARELL